jgi:hypothetical protein
VLSESSPADSAILNSGFCLSLLGCAVEIQCEDIDTFNFLRNNYGFLADGKKMPQLKYVVGRQKGSSAFFIQREGQEPLGASDDSEFLYLFEKDLTIELQKLRADLYFLHGAVVQFGDKAFILTGPSGSGKSLTTWALLQQGFLYLSDELGPVDLRTMEVYAYPHALCLKRRPPPRYPLPEETLYTSSTTHVPIDSIPGKMGKALAPVAAIFFLSYCAERFEPVLLPISKAKAGARLYTNALNPLAQPDDGLDAALLITKNVACFELYSGDLSRTCTVIKNAVEGVLDA